MTFWDNIFNNEQECSEWINQQRLFKSNGWTKKPLIASLLLSYDCNIKCKYCPFQDYPNKVTHKSFEEWSELIEGIVESGVRRISFSGGEPLLYADLNRLLKRATELGIKKGIVTNGVGLTLQKMKQYEDSGLNALTVSVDTLDANMYARICNTTKGVLDRVLEKIIFARMRQKYWVGINTVITAMNVNQINPIIDFCSKNDVFLQFQIFNPFEGCEDLMPAVNELRAAINLIKLHKKRGAPVENSYDYLEACFEFAQSRTFPKQMKCFIPFVELVITPDLKMKVCCLSDEIGNVTKEGLKKLWRDELADHWRAQAHKKKCRNCFLIYHEPLTLM